MIAAVAHNRIIGADNDMPWHLPADLKHFKAVTMGKPVIMGRKTYESIGKALPGRKNIVVSRSGFQADDAVVVTDCEAAITTVADAEEVMIIGGGAIYELFLSKADTLHLTFIDLDVAGDTQFPDYKAHADWEEVNREAYKPDEKNKHPLEFVELRRLV